MRKIRSIINRVLDSIIATLGLNRCKKDISTLYGPAPTGKYGVPSKNTTVQRRSGDTRNPKANRKNNTEESL